MEIPAGSQFKSITRMVETDFSAALNVCCFGGILNIKVSQVFGVCKYSVVM